jgi:REP element-mobilizing transposase RayT
MFHRRRLPHWESPGSPLFVTSCLAGSLSAAGMLDVRRFHQRLAQRNAPVGCPEKTWQRTCEVLVFRRRDAWLDGQRDGSLLASPQIAAIVRDAMLHFHGLRYDVFAYVIMPSHLHWIFRPRAEWVEELEMQGSVRSPRETIMHSLLSFTALEMNRALHRKGPVWQSESYDRCLRSDEELMRVTEYVENNPVKAGLCRRPEDWEWSSAWQAGSLPHR